MLKIIHRSRKLLILIYWIGHQDANDAFNISLVSPSKSGLSTIATFHPSFTYTIFGDEEKIFGYKDLKIQLRYRANDMRPHLQLAYGKKFKPVGEHEPADVKEILESGGHLPKGLGYLSSDNLILIIVVANLECSCVCESIRF
jgi:hypothetical protein